MSPYCSGSRRPSMFRLTPFRTVTCMAAKGTGRPRHRVSRAPPPGRRFVTGPTPLVTDTSRGPHAVWAPTPKKGLRMRFPTLLAVMAAAIAVAAGVTHATAAETSVYKVWSQRSGKLWLVKRQQPLTSAPARAAMQALLTGPNLAESDAGVGSQVPASADLLGLSVANGTATVDLSSGFATSGTTAQVRMRLAQLTWTLAQFPTIDQVSLQVNGRTVSSLAGVRLPRPMTQDSFAGLLPPITVWNPAIGTALSDSVRVSGNATVFEGSLHIRILNHNGTSIGYANTTASCGTGCRGGYTILVPFRAGGDQLGTVVVTDDDTDGNGKPQHQVRVPVVLLS